MRKLRLMMLMVTLVMVLPLSACGGKKQECDKCSKDSDCDQGLSCEEFFDTKTGKSLGEACASIFTTTCTF